jgi:hypothetical protein
MAAWEAARHGKRTWRKSHLAVNPDSSEILASELTTNDQGDTSLVGPLLDQIYRPIASVTANGAYDGDPVYHAIAERQPDAAPAVIIPPRVTAVPCPTADFAPGQRDRHIQLIEDKGRMGWQKAVGNGERSIPETAIFRCKVIMARSLRTRRHLPRRAKPGSRAP